MADDFNMVLELLRAIRGDLNAMREEQRMHGQRLTGIERHMSNLHGDMANSAKSSTA